jgi:hypothetical protein
MRTLAPRQAATRAAQAAAGWLLLTAFLDLTCGPAVDPESGCPQTLRNGIATQLDLKVWHSEPKECPVRIQQPGIPSKSFVLEIWDNQDRIPQFTPVTTTFKTAQGQLWGGDLCHHGRYRHSARHSGSLRSYRSIIHSRVRRISR